MSAVLSVSGLSKSFGGVQAVQDVSFEVGEGEMLAMIGPNGAGKTTCFNMVNGQLRPDGGTVRIGGAETVGRKPREIWRMGVGRTFQITATFASMTVAVPLIAAARRAFRFGMKPAAAVLPVAGIGRAGRGAG